MVSNRTIWNVMYTLIFLKRNSNYISKLNASQGNWSMISSCSDAILWEILTFSVNNSVLFMEWFLPKWTIILLISIHSVMLSSWVLPSFQQFTPRPVQWSGTFKKYLSIASQNRVLYSSGETTVGIFPCPPKMPVDFTTISSFLSQVNVLI